MIGANGPVGEILHDPCWNVQEDGKVPAADSSQFRPESRAPAAHWVRVSGAVAAFVAPSATLEIAV